jgi:hypothetical protein
MRAYFVIDKNANICHNPVNASLYWQDFVVADQKCHHTHGFLPKQLKRRTHNDQGSLEDAMKYQNRLRDKAGGNAKVFLCSTFGTNFAATGRSAAIPRSASRRTGVLVSD